MLAKPYKLIYELVHNKYYYLDLMDSPYPHLAFESVEFMDTYTKRFLRKPKVTPTDLTQSMKILPLHALTVFLMAAYSDINLLWDADDVKIYDVWRDADLADLKTVFSGGIKESDDILSASGHRSDIDWTTPVTTKNGVVKGLVKEGYYYMALESRGSLFRTYWLVRTTSGGVLSIVSVNESGRIAEPVTSSVNFYHIDTTLATLVKRDFMDSDGLFKNRDLHGNYAIEVGKDNREMEGAK